jgi:hypothetical protein
VQTADYPDPTPAHVAPKPGGPAERRGRSRRLRLPGTIHWSFGRKLAGGTALFFVTAALVTVFLMNRSLFQNRIASRLATEEVMGLGAVLSASRRARPRFRRGRRRST